MIFSPTNPKSDPKTFVFSITLDFIFSFLFLFLALHDESIVFRFFYLTVFVYLVQIQTRLMKEFILELEKRKDRTIHDVLES